MTVCHDKYPPYGIGVIDDSRHGLVDLTKLLANVMQLCTSAALNSDLHHRCPRSNLTNDLDSIHEGGLALVVVRLRLARILVLYKRRISIYWTCRVPKRCIGVNQSSKRAIGLARTTVVVGRPFKLLWIFQEIS